MYFRECECMHLPHFLTILAYERHCGPICYCCCYCSQRLHACYVCKLHRKSSNIQFLESKKYNYTHRMEVKMRTELPGIANYDTSKQFMKAIHIITHICAYPAKTLSFLVSAFLYQWGSAYKGWRNLDV